MRLMLMDNLLVLAVLDLKRTQTLVFSQMWIFGVEGIKGKCS